MTAVTSRPLVLVTGVEQAEGAYIARVLYSMGYHVVAHSFSAESADRVATALDDTRQRVSPATADLTIECEVEQLFGELDRRFGGIDALVHAAWLPAPESACATALADIHPHDWHRCVHVHTSMVLLTSRRATSSFRRGTPCGRIVVVTGLGGKEATADGIRPLVRQTIDGAVESFAVAAAARRGVDVPSIYAVRVDRSEAAQHLGVQIVETVGSSAPPDRGRVQLARPLRRTGVHLVAPEVS
jgi:3-oxoacyl-[acyl-carrier protein] reductase